MLKIRAGEVGEAGLYVPLLIDLDKNPHWLITGGSGSGKTILVLYLLNSILNYRLELFVGDPKGSGNFRGITGNYAEYDECIELIETAYKRYLEIKRNRTGEKLLLLIDEYPSLVIRLEATDKKRAAGVKAMIAELLMQGRSLPGNGMVAVWLIAQRPDADYFPKGARLNFMVVIGMGRLDTQSKQMLFPGEEMPVYRPMTGTGLILVDGQPLRILHVPQIETKRLTDHLQRKSQSRYPDQRCR